jgi:hypothetical protein
MSSTANAIELEGAIRHPCFAIGDLLTEVEGNAGVQKVAGGQRHSRPSL